jgi:hypothetical protein
MKEVEINGVKYMEEETSDRLTQNPCYVPLPCPFCGGKAKAVHHHYKANYLGMRTTFNNFTTMEARTVWNVRCLNESCLVQPFTKLEDDKQEAIRKWNVRSNGT